MNGPARDAQLGKLGMPHDGADSAGGPRDVQSRQDKMALASDTDWRDWRRQQSAAALYLRSRLGGLLYLIGWGVVAVAGGIANDHAWIGLALSVAFILLALWRLFDAPRGTDAASLHTWLRRYGPVMLGSAAIWGAVQAWVLLDGHFDSATRTAALVATVGYSTVFANVYAMVRSVAIAGMVMMMGPAVLVLWVLPGQVPLAAIMSLYAGYLAFALVLAHSDHRRRLDLDQALHQQRDLFERLSRTDPLTGLHNRRHFNAELDAAAECARSGAAGFALMIIDIDHFKSVNDRFGHAAGDTCLVGLADRLQQAFHQPGMLLARLGGEEFAVLIANMDEGGAQALAEGFRATMAAEPMASDGQRLAVTVSIGVGAFDLRRHGDGDGLFRAVDAALYAAKHAGRNRVLAVQEH